jgi:hypothetical protein
VHHGWYFTKNEPYFCLGFLFNKSIAYISDVAYIPDSTWKLLEGHRPEQGEVTFETEATNKEPKQVIQEAKESLTDTGRASRPEDVSDDAKTAPRPPVLIIDCLRVYPHTSHFG